MLNVPRLAGWADHFRRALLGRPAWSANEEFAFYSVTPERIRQHRERQRAFAREAHATGLSIMRAMGILDTQWLKDKAVLDIGAGECVLSNALAFAGHAQEVWAMDATPKQIFAAAEASGGSPQLKFVIGDAQDLPFADNSFDVVVANLVLHHIHPLDGVLREAARVLRGGGMFIAFEPNPITGSLTHEQTSTNEAPIPPRSIRNSLALAGFDDIETTYWWTRLATSSLGPLSPGFRIRAKKPGSATRADKRTRRSLVPLGLPHLDCDEGCSFADLARAQAKEIRDLLASAGD